MRISKTMKSLGLAAVAVLLVAISLTACAPPQPSQQFTLRIGFLSVQDGLPYFVMQAQGIDKKNGLLFVEKQYQSGAAIIEDLAADALDMSITIGTVPVLSAAQSGMIPSKIVLVAANTFADPDHPQIGVLVAPSINRWQDLKGQQIAVNAVNSLNGAGIKARLQLEGVSDYTLVEIPFANMGLALAGGNIAAVTIPDPYLAQSLLRKDGKFLGWLIGEPPLKSIENTVIMSSANFYRDKPQAVKAFLRTYLEVLKWIDRNPDGARVILGKKLNLAPEVVQKIKLPRFSLNGRNDPSQLDNMQKVLMQVGMLKAPIPANKLYDETLLNEVLSEKR